MIKGDGTMKPPTALELLEEYRLRFRTVTLKPHGFSKRGSNRYFYFGIDRKGVREIGTISYLDLDKIKKPIIASYFSDDKRSMIEQMTARIWEMAIENILPGVKFYIDPVGDIGKLLLPQIYPPQEVDITLSCNQSSISGFYLGSMKTSEWQTFIPGDTHEGKAITAALAFEKAEREWASDLATFEKAFRESLTAVSEKVVLA